ncbi:MAG TPA: hypothetical protein DCK79_09365 [Candidatus Atribacteria bacterium]|jgi:hypothetical protein|nr:hypothetical protein [Candidatus Atribacteria bacterium]
MPEDISEEALVEAFCKYVEDDYYDWLKDNFKSFFNYGNSDWLWIGERIKKFGRVIKNKNWTKVFTFIIICIQLRPEGFP